MNILLASVYALPELVNGKVCVINDDNTYTLYNPARNCQITDNYDPMNYSILIHEKYSKCIVYSRKEEREHFLVNQQVKKLRRPSYRVGDRIHIHSRRGIYTIVELKPSSIVITCKKWQYDPMNSTVEIPHSDFSALAGGLHNAVFE